MDDIGIAKMLVGVPKEIKDSEYRVGLVPSTVRERTSNGHHVLVEKSAGLGAGLGDADYRAVGAEIVPDAGQVYARSDLIVKVKEPLAPERKKLGYGQILFTYLHLAADPQLTADLMASGVIAIAYETVTSPQGTLPLLTPMSEVAGRMAPHVGARCLEKENGGRGVLLGGVPGVPPADVVILGGGVAGSHAALISAGMGATVTVIGPPRRRSTELLTSSVTTASSFRRLSSARILKCSRTNSLARPAAPRSGERTRQYWLPSKALFRSIPEVVRGHPVPSQGGLQDIGLARASHERSNPPKVRVELARRMSVTYHEITREHEVVS